MKALKFDIEIPFWCSFKEFGTVNSHLTYPFPPPPTIFGLILNALGRPALHTIGNGPARQKLESEYFDVFDKLKFSILVRKPGIKIDDYSNILKRNRGSDNLERHLQNLFKSVLGQILSDEISEATTRNAKITEIVKASGKYRFFESDLIENQIQPIKGISPQAKKKISDFLYDYWGNDNAKYDISKHWQKTQVSRQRLINSIFTVILASENQDLYSTENISAKLKDPQRPTYCGESDDLVVLKVYDIRDVMEKSISSSSIHSVIPGVFPNSAVVSVLVALRNQKKADQRKICSIPHGDIAQEISCYQLGGDYFVFL